MFYLATVIAKIVKYLIRLIRRGSGYTWPGHVALKLVPGLLKSLGKHLPKNVVLVSGTNGKTTTTKLITHILEEEGHCVLSNKSGANLVNGVVSSILLGDRNCAYAVFEVDEFSLEFLLKYIKPSILVLLNLSRDQLDRHWETDVVLEKWKKALGSMCAENTLILDDEKHLFPDIKNIYKGEVKYFSTNIKLLENTGLIGSFNAKNIDCALTVTSLFGVSYADGHAHLSNFKYAFGRGEIINYLEKPFRLLLAKNPASLNSNLQLLVDNPEKYDSIVFVLNDNIPDGLDVSWIYDVDPFIIKEACLGAEIYVSGTRAYDMAVRLRYAGIRFSEQSISEDLTKILSIVASGDCKKPFVLPNYSAMLETRNILVGRKIL